ncbi:tubulin polyglutamylase TTLL5-like isoform X2 [Babylonia areolata]|uniref:tubulin polyglutamylase TTLL5-like isoform X2 n=1 Tax=Babylonia areolata TaxID=304850 RepID=UPI003FD273E0
MASQGNNSDGGESLTPSEQSDGEERSEHDSDYESDNEKDDDNDSRDKNLNIIWTGYGKRIPVILFSVSSILHKSSDFKTVGERYNMTFKFGGSECKIIRNILGTHGFREVHHTCPDFNLAWTNCHLKPFTIRNLSEFQKINHFPRSSELTRKDRLYKNIQRMQQIRGVRHFDFVPQTFVMPGEYQEFCSYFLKDRGPWIVKPVASSRGRGVFLVTNPDQVPVDENVIVSHYLHNPLVIDGFKFDIRLYVAVTSYDPLVIYLYEEGLTRFATVKYERSVKHMRNQCMHLTNYSVNKKSNDYVRNDDPDVEDYGNKWSMGAMLRYLRSIGKDTAVLMMRIEDVVIKTLLSVELTIATACKMFMPFRGNCFELYGFDILVDDTLKPWVLEVNLSPSLACDSPLDLKIKGNLLCDLFSLTGIVCHDPTARSMQHQNRRNQDFIKMTARAKTAFTRSGHAKPKARPQSATCSSKSSSTTTQGVKTGMAGLNSEEIKILRRVREEEQRKGGWIRIFPGPDTWDVHGPFLQFGTSHNLMLHQRLYPERHKPVAIRSIGSGSFSAATRSKNGYLQVMGTGRRLNTDTVESYTLAMNRSMQYERKLGTRTSKRRRKFSRQKDIRGRLVQGMGDDLEDGEGEEDYQQVDGRGKHYEQGGGDRRPSLRAGDKTVREVRVEASHPLPPSLTQNPAAAASAQLLPPPAPTPLPKYNVVEVLMKGGMMTKVQARSAFAMYLRRVKERMMADGGASMGQEEVDTLNEQMDLVLRFLKRAAVNLQQTFRVVIPSRKLTLSDRRRILAKQLADFVNIYTRETEQLKHLLKLTEKSGSRNQGLQNAADAEIVMDEVRFDQFICIASESELEQILTTYTKLNKSSSIFLGSSLSTSSAPMKPPHNPPPSPQVQRLEVMQQRQQRQQRGPGEGGGDGEHQATMSTTAVVAPHHNTLREHSASCLDSQVAGSVGLPLRPSSASSPSAAVGAVAPVCFQRLGRPLSATNYKPQVKALQTQVAWTDGQNDVETFEVHSQSLKLISRPSSAKPSPFSTSEPVIDTYNEEAIREALQRLTVRQQARQYAAGNSSIAIQPPSTGEAAREERHHRGSLCPLEEQVDHGTTHPGILHYRPSSGTFSRSHQQGQGNSVPVVMPQRDSNHITVVIDHDKLAASQSEKSPSPQQSGSNLHSDAESQGENGSDPTVTVSVPVTNPARLGSGRQQNKSGLSHHITVRPGSLRPPHPQLSYGMMNLLKEESEQHVQKRGMRKEKAGQGTGTGMGRPPVAGKEELESRSEAGNSVSAGCASVGGGDKASLLYSEVSAAHSRPAAAGFQPQLQRSQSVESSSGPAAADPPQHSQSAQTAAPSVRSTEQRSQASMEASKARHHAMVAQAHAAQRVTSGGRSAREASKPPHVTEVLEGSIARGTPTFSPKPPIHPMSSRSQQSLSHRVTRLSSVENISINFHSSLKTDTQSQLHKKAEGSAAGK